MWTQLDFMFAVEKAAHYVAQRFGLIANGGVKHLFKAHPQCLADPLIASEIRSRKTAFAHYGEYVVAADGEIVDGQRMPRCKRCVDSSFETLVLSVVVRWNPARAYVCMAQLEEIAQIAPPNSPDEAPHARVGDDI